MTARNFSAIQASYFATKGGAVTLKSGENPMIIKTVLGRAFVVALLAGTVCILTPSIEATADEAFGPFIKLNDGEELLAEIHFDTNSTQPTYIGQKKIESVIAGLKETKATQLRIVGFTDRTGSEAVNKAIAEDRAESVADLLQQSGLDIPVVIDPRGEEGLLFPTPDGETEPLNRCVGIIAMR